MRPYCAIPCLINAPLDPGASAEICSSFRSDSEFGGLSFAASQPGALSPSQIVSAPETFAVNELCKARMDAGVHLAPHPEILEI